jgi:hypothetical protein
MNVQPTDGAGSPRRWWRIFRRRAKLRWINWLVPGRYKHVAVFGYVAECDTWIFFDAWLGGTNVQLARGDSARAMMLVWTRDADVLRMDAIPPARRRVLDMRMLCTTAIAHLVGVPGALLPVILYRQCLAHGAVLIHGHAEPEPAARPNAAGAAQAAQQQQIAALEVEAQGDTASLMARYGTHLALANAMAGTAIKGPTASPLLGQR